MGERRERGLMSALSSFGTWHCAKLTAGWHCVILTSWHCAMLTLHWHCDKLTDGKRLS